MLLDRLAVTRLHVVLFLYYKYHRRSSIVNLISNILLVNWLFVISERNPTATRIYKLWPLQDIIALTAHLHVHVYTLTQSYHPCKWSCQYYNCLTL